MEKKFSAALGVCFVAGLGLANACGENQAKFAAVQKLSVPKAVVTAAASDSNRSEKAESGTGSADQSGQNVSKAPEAVAPNLPASGEKKFVAANESFTIQASAPPPSDFVFVVDSSRSMETLITRFMRGFEDIPSSGYPPNTKMAVMNMVSHKLDDPSEPLAVKSSFESMIRDMRNHDYWRNFVESMTQEKLKSVMNAEPGYLRFVNADSVSRYKQTALNTQLSSGNNTYSNQTLATVLDVSKRYPVPLCNAEWFTPTDTNGVQSSPARCLTAAMQISQVIGIESGLSAVHQMLKKNKGRTLFREKAAVHFVFISDTHDQGDSQFEGFENYLRSLPTYAQIAQAAKETLGEVSLVKLHGLVPFSADRSTCPDNEHNRTEDVNGNFGGSYLPQIAASGGIAVDMCGGGNINYRAVVNQILNEARKIPPFKLQGTGVKDVSVKLNNVDYKNFQVIDGHSVEVNGLMENQNYTVEISYTREAM